MATIVNCVCPIPLGATACKTQTGISELYYTPYQNIISIVYQVSASLCCTNSEISSFALDAAAPDGLLQPINFVQQDDDTGALFSAEDNYDAGNTVRNYTFSFQTNSNNPNEECTLDSMVGQQVAFLYKGKDSRWRFINWSGGLKVASVTWNSNQAYKILTLNGRAKDRALFVSYTDAGVWATANLVPISIDPVNGLINA